MAFLDDEGLDPAPSGPGSRRAGGERQRQLLVRRLVALAIGVLVLILILLAVRGCLDARKERGFENYVSDLDSIVTQSNQLSAEFFDRLQNPPQGLNELGIEAEVASDRGTAEGLLQRVEGLDTPDDLEDSHDELVQAFELRRDGLAGIAEDIPTALGEEGRSDAIDRIVGDMQGFLASDVLYERAQVETQGVLESEQITGRVQDSQFLPPPQAPWLDNTELTVTLNAFASSTGNVPEGIHGVELLSTTVDKTPLAVDVENSVSLGNDPPEITVEVQNGGDTEESDVIVSYSLTGSSSPIEGDVPIASIDAQGVEEATVPLEEAPATEEPLTLEVEVLPVLGETVIDNNTASYTVVFN